MLAGPTPCSSCVGSHSTVNSWVQRPRYQRIQTFIAFLHTLWLFLHSSHPSCTVFPVLWRRVIEMFYLELGTQQSLIVCTLTTQRPVVSVLTVALCKQKFLWPRLKIAQIWLSSLFLPRWKVICSKRSLLSLWVIFVLIKSLMLGCMGSPSWEES